MKKRCWTRAVAAGLALLLLAAPMAARADDDGGGDERDDDHDFARELYEHGEIRALYDVLQTLRQQVSGDIVSVELIQTPGGWRYRFQVIAPDGQRRFVDVDAGPAPAGSERGHD